MSFVLHVLMLMSELLVKIETDRHFHGQTTMSFLRYGGVRILQSECPEGKYVMLAYRVTTEAFFVVLRITDKIPIAKQLK